MTVTPRPNHDPVFTKDEYEFTVSLQDLMYGVPLSGEMPYATDEDNDPITYTTFPESSDPFSVNTMMGNTVEYSAGWPDRLFRAVGSRSDRMFYHA